MSGGAADWEAEMRALQHFQGFLLFYFGLIFYSILRAFSFLPVIFLWLLCDPGHQSRDGQWEQQCREWGECDSEIVFPAFLA